MGVNQTKGLVIGDDTDTETLFGIMPGQSGDCCRLAGTKKATNHEKMGCCHKGLLIWVRWDGGKNPSETAKICTGLILTEGDCKVTPLLYPFIT